MSPFACQRGRALSCLLSSLFAFGPAVLGRLHFVPAVAKDFLLRRRYVSTFDPRPVTRYRSAANAGPLWTLRKQGI